MSYLLSDAPGWLFVVVMIVFVLVILVAFSKFIGDVSTEEPDELWPDGKDER
jgi:hypothetical protein